MDRDHPRAPNRDLVLERLGEFFAARADAFVCAYLFGSVARDEATAASDVDVAVLRRTPGRGTLASTLLAAEGELERKLERPVQLIDLLQVEPDLVHRVLRDGILIHERDPSARIAFEVRARNEYFDVRPFVDRYRRRNAAR